MSSRFVSGVSLLFNVYAFVTLTMKIAQKCVDYDVLNNFWKEKKIYLERVAVIRVAAVLGKLSYSDCSKNCLLPLQCRIHKGLYLSSSHPSAAS